MISNDWGNSKRDNSAVSGTGDIESDLVNTLFGTSSESENQ